MVSVIAEIAVVVTVMGIAVRAVVMVHVGMLTMVVSAQAPVTVASAVAATMPPAAVAATAMTVGLNGDNVDAQGGQENHPDYQDSKSAVFGRIHEMYLLHQGHYYFIT